MIELRRAPLPEDGGWVGGAVGGRGATSGRGGGGGRAPAGGGGNTPDGGKAIKLPEVLLWIQQVLQA